MEQTLPANPESLMNCPLAFVNAKLRGRKRRLFEGESLEELKRMKSVEELWERFYPRRVPGRRLGLERQLRQDATDELVSFTRYLSPPLARFYFSMLSRFQIDNIHVLLRLFVGGAEVDRSQYVVNLPDSLAVPSASLLSSSDLSEFVQKLPEKLLSAAELGVELDEKSNTTAFTEMALMKAYWDGVSAGLKNIGISHRSECAGPLALEAASERLLAVVRAGRHYKIDWENLSNVLCQWNGPIPEQRSLFLSSSRLEEIFNDPSSENIASAVPSLTAEDAGDLLKMEEKLWRRTSTCANRLYRQMLGGPAILVSYFYLRRNELRNLFQVVESTYYGN
ncbi:MAG: V0D/AC39 family V-type ATPase subunit [Candidatus Brocadiia bacterium]